MKRWIFSQDTIDDDDDDDRQKIALWDLILKTFKKSISISDGIGLRRNERFHFKKYVCGIPMN